ncbi:hypothetical protein QQY66_33665 [Streptomyces sp. DG2A-72]|uniref:hypothetical protein n=1 Tax=Streptomyces sp. DG2A-72 TaxID=3051386 RepID=UPI00265C060F|nr:hypothetical protein [Streptomyces sp. DG2A-72]MDO0936407.1 hypothetical protein [Streptomyces sp. DG2A-72]
MTAPSPFAVPERLLALGTEFTRHHDALSAITLLRGPDPASNLSRHIPRTQALARGALDVPDLLRGLMLYRSPAILAGLARTKQLAALATAAADHLLDAVDFLHDAHRPTTDPEDMATAYRRALLEAGQRVTLALQLTALGAEDCLTAADTFARQMRRQHLTPNHRPPSLSPTQHAALEAAARGDMTLDRLNDKPFVRRGDARVTISTIRSLEARDLVKREECPLLLHDQRIHLTTEGCRTLAATLGRPPTPALATPRIAAPLASNTSRPQAR